MFCMVFTIGFAGSRQRERINPSALLKTVTYLAGQVSHHVQIVLDIIRRCKPHFTILFETYQPTIYNYIYN